MKKSRFADSQVAFILRLAWGSDLSRAFAADFAPQPLQVSYALLERPDFTGADDPVVSLNSGLATVA